MARGPTPRPLILPQVSRGCGGWPPLPQPRPAHGPLGASQSRWGSGGHPPATARGGARGPYRGAPRRIGPRAVSIATVRPACDALSRPSRTRPAATRRTSSIKGRQSSDIRLATSEGQNVPVPRASASSRIASAIRRSAEGVVTARTDARMGVGPDIRQDLPAPQALLALRACEGHRDPRYLVEPKGPLGRRRLADLHA